MSKKQSKQTTLDAIASPLSVAGAKDEKKPKKSLLEAIEAIDKVDKKTKKEDDDKDVVSSGSSTDDEVSEESDEEASVFQPKSEDDDDEDEESSSSESESASSSASSTSESSESRDKKRKKGKTSKADQEKSEFELWKKFQKEKEKISEKKRKRPSSKKSGEPSKNAVETETRVPSQSREIPAHAKETQKKVEPVTSTSSTTSTTTTTIVIAEPKKAAKKNTTGVELGASGAAKLEDLVQKASSLVNSKFEDAELINYMKLSPKHTEVILAAFHTNYAVINSRPVLSKSARVALDNQINGKLCDNTVAFNPNEQKSRDSSLRSIIVVLCTQNGRLVPTATAKEDPLTNTRVSTENDTAELAAQRKASLDRNAEFERAYKALKPYDRAYEDFQRELMLRLRVLSDIKLSFLLPYLSECHDSGGPLACFAINGEGDPFFLDKKGFSKFFGIRMPAAMIKTGSLVPIDDKGVPAVCMLSFGHWIVDRFRTELTKKIPAEEKRRLSPEKYRIISAFQESLFYNDPPERKLELFKLLFPNNAVDVPVDWFKATSNKIWIRETGKLPDRSDKPTKVDNDDEANSDGEEAPTAPKSVAEAPKPTASKKKKKSDGPAKVEDADARAKIVADREKTPPANAQEPRVHPELFFVDKHNAPSDKFALSTLAVDAADKLTALVPIRTLEQATQKYAVQTIEAHTTAAQNDESKGKKKRRAKDDDDDDDDDEAPKKKGSADEDGEDDDEESSEDDAAVDGKAVASRESLPSEAKVNFIAAFSHIEHSRVRHAFFAENDPHLAHDVYLDCRSLNLELDATERKRFAAARRLYDLLPEEEVKKIGKQSDASANQICFALIDQYDASLREELRVGLKSGAWKDFGCEEAEQAKILALHQKWFNENGGKPALAKTRTVKKASITSASQRVPKPARGQLTVAGSMLDGTAKLPSPPSHTWLARKMSVDSIDPKAPLTLAELRAVLDHCAAKDGHIDLGTSARVLIDESLFLEYVKQVLDKKFVRGSLIESDSDLSNLPYIGRKIAAPNSGFAEFVAGCLVMQHVLAAMGAYIRSGQYSADRVKSVAAELQPLLASGDFSPFEMWKAPSEEKSKFDAHDAKLAEKMMEISLPEPETVAASS